MPKKVYIIAAGALVLAVVVWLVLDTLVPMMTDDGKGLPPKARSLAARAEAEYSEKNYSAAERDFEEAMNQASKVNRLTPQVLIKYADMQLEWSMSPVLAQDEKRGRVNKARNAYRRALQLNGSEVHAQRRLAELAWGEASSGGAQWPVYIKEADALLAMDEKDALTYFRRGIASAEIGRAMGGAYVKNAMADLRKALELRPSEGEFWLSYCQVLQRFEPAQLEQAFGDAIKAAGDKAVIHAAYGDFLASGGRDDEALRQYHEAIKVEPKNMMGYMALARFYNLRGKDYPFGMQALMDAKTADPADHQPYRELALMARRRGQLEQAMAIVREGLSAVKPRTSTAPSAMPAEAEQRRVEAAKAELYYLLVDMLLEWGDSHPQDRAKSLAEAKSYRDQISLMGKAIIERVEGRFAMAEGRLDDAIRLLEASAADSPGGDTQTAFLLVKVYLTTNQPLKAMPVADRFIQLPGFDRNPLGHVLKAQVLMHMRQLSQAGDEIGLALKMQPDNRVTLEVKAELERMMSASQPATRP